VDDATLNWQPTGWRLDSRSTNDACKETGSCLRGLSGNAVGCRAIYLVLEFGSAVEGLMQISSAPLRGALLPLNL